MRIEVIGRSVGLDGALRDRIERRLGFALGRFGGRVARVSVLLSDANGPKGGIDKRCLVVAELSVGRRPVVVEDADSDVATLVDRAADRVGEAVRRRLERDRWLPGIVPPEHVELN